MDQVRVLFLDASRLVLSLLRRDEVARAWDEPSVLREFSVRGLCGHLFRATGSVLAYLDRSEPETDPISAPKYYAAAIGEPGPIDLGSDLHRAIRARGDEAAAAGHGALVSSFTSTIADLAERLEREPARRKVEVFKGLVLLLDDYLVTRLVELTVHADDLAQTLGSDAPVFPAGVYDLVFDCLLGVARLRHGDPAVLRALTRRERDAVEALRVL
ncbi:MAG TPA: maleylpyruvate isomerase N-terminal domain-containing protein [Actinomycetota bacterium]|nr:maleylpyruvate isomerase N-terminal domain-containing protein [Actinomycetota bacterium]